MIKDKVEMKKQSGIVSVKFLPVRFDVTIIILVKLSTVEKYTLNIVL